MFLLIQSGLSKWSGGACTFHGLLIPLKNSGIHMGKTTASFRSFLASSKSAISSLHKHFRFLPVLISQQIDRLFYAHLLWFSVCRALYHLTLGFWDIMSLSKVSTRSLSSPPLSNFFTSVSVLSDLFCRKRNKDAYLFAWWWTLLPLVKLDKRVCDFGCL